MKKLTHTTLSLILLLTSLGARAQSASPSKSSGGQNPVSTVLLSGLVGGVLGLSTLSFYKHPEDHIANIPIGAAAGLILSTLSVSYTGVTETAERTSPIFIAPDPVREEIALRFAKSF